MNTHKYITLDTYIEMYTYEGAINRQSKTSSSIILQVFFCNMNLTKIEYIGRNTVLIFIIEDSLDLEIFIMMN